MASKANDSQQPTVNAQVETTPQLPLQQAVDAIQQDAQTQPQLFLQESEVPHGGE